MYYNYAYKTEEAVFELTKFDVKLCKINQSYLINNKLTNTYLNSYYKEQVNNIKSLLHNQLKTGLNHKEFLRNLISMLEKRIEWLEKMKYNSINFFKNHPIETTEATYFSAIGISNKTSFEDYSNNIVVPNVEQMKAFWFLDLYKKEFNDYKNIIDFEKGLLLYIVTLYKRAISNLIKYVKPLFEKVEFINFNKINFENLHDARQGLKKDSLCHLNLDKKNVAHLFRILIEEKLIVFNELNDLKNLTEMKSYVEDNFTYQNAKKERKYIDKLNREYAEASWRLNDDDKIRHIRLIDKLILILQTRKANLKY